MTEPTEQEILAKLRTLLALERNYLAEERTALAEFRTGLALTVIAPAASTIIAYTFSFLQLEYVLLLEAFNFIFFAILTIWGLLTSFRSRSKFNRIRNKKINLKNVECEVIKKSKSVHDLFRNCITEEDEHKMRR